MKGRRIDLWEDAEIRTRNMIRNDEPTERFTLSATKYLQNYLFDMKHGKNTTIPYSRKYIASL